MKNDYEKLIDKYSAAVFRCAYSFVNNRYDAEDIMQEVFLKYLVKKPAFHDENHEKAWFLRVTINLSKNYLRSIWYKKVELREDMISAIYTDASNNHLWDSISKLPKKYRIPIVLHYMEGYSIKEISQMMMKKSATIGTWISRGRDLLKKMEMEEENERK